jgi:Rieske Fe-S protein
VSSLDIVRQSNRQTAQEEVSPYAGTAAVRVRSRVDLYVNLPDKFSSKLPPRLQSELTEAFTELAASSVFKRLGIQVPKPSPVATEDTAGDRALIAGLVAKELTWTRNPPSIADEFEITLRGDALPVDLRLFESIQVFGWIFVHDNYADDLDDAMSRLRPGDPGSFGGVVDTVERDDATGNITLSCRDFTTLLLAREVGPDVFNGIDMNQTLDAIVLTLVNEVPGGDKWLVTPRGAVAGLNAVSTKMAEEQRKKKKRGTWETIVVPDKNAISSIQVKEVEWNGGTDQALVNKVMGRGTAKIKTTTYGDNRQKVELVPRSTPESYSQRLAIKSKRVYRPAVYQTKVVKATPDRIFGSKRMSVWDAITRVCQLMGCVAEVGVSTSGNPMVVIVDGLELQDGQTLRAFERNGKRHRVVVHGDDIAQLVERRQLIGGPRVNWVEVYSTDPVTGRTLRERFDDGGRDADGKRLDSNGMTVFAHGANSSEALQRIARRVYAQVNRGELEVTFSSSLPWSSGGDVDDADLLWCGPGALVEMQFARADRFKGLELEDALKLLGVPKGAARKLAEASERLKPSVVFQVAEIVHTLGEGGEYRADFIAQALLDDIRLARGDSLEAL